MANCAQPWQLRLVRRRKLDGQRPRHKRRSTCGKSLFLELLPLHFLGEDIQDEAPYTGGVRALRFTDVKGAIALYVEQDQLVTLLLRERVDLVPHASLGRREETQR